MTTDVVLSPPPDPGTVDTDNPWPGLTAFREADQPFFHGRDGVIHELTRTVIRSNLTVLYGLSGLGKTSLLQAGVFPPLRRENVLPVYIRLTHSDDPAALRHQVWESIRRAADAAGVEAQPPDEADTLWEYFHRKTTEFWNDRNRLVTPMLAFDQFEEIFTLGRSDPDRRARSRAFTSELADLIEGRPSPEARERFEREPESAMAFSMSDRPCKVLLSLREDFLPDFGELRSEIPSLLVTAFRLQRMTGDEAREVVQRGGDRLIDRDVSEQVVRFVASARSEDTDAAAAITVEPALLSLFCRELNNKRRAQGRPQITADLLEGSRKEIIGDFYERTLAAPGLGRRVRVFIEERLLTESGFRDSIAEEQALRTRDLQASDLDALVERRLLRREDDGRGRARIELTHDVLAEAVRVSRDRRRVVEQEELRQANLRDVEARARRAAEEAAARAQQEREVESARTLAAKEREAAELAQAVAAGERRARVRQRRYIAALAVLVAAISVSAWLAMRARNETREALATAYVDRSTRGEAWPIAFLAAAVRNNPANVTARALLYARLLEEVAQVSDLPQGAPVIVAAFSPDARRLLTASADGAVALWDTGSGSRIAALADRGPRPAAAAFSPDGSRIVTADGSTARLWHGETGAAVGEPFHNEGPIAGAVFDAAGAGVIIVAAGGSVRLWDPQGGAPRVLLTAGAGAGVSKVVFSPDRAFLLTLTVSGATTDAQLWNLRSGLAVGERRHVGDAKRVAVAAFSPDSSLVLTSSTDVGAAELWTTAAGTRLGDPLIAPDISAAAFSPDGKSFAFGSSDGSARIWSVGSTEARFPPIQQGGLIASITFSPDGARVLTAADDGIAQQWDVEKIEPLGGPLRHEQRVVSAEFSRDGRRIVTASDDGHARLWDARTGVVAATAIFHGGPVNWAGFNADGTKVVTASADCTARVWDVRTAAAIGPPLGHDDQVLWAAVSPDGERVVTASLDRTARLWDARSGKLTATLHHGDTVAYAGFSPDGTRVVTASFDRTARVWDAATGSPSGPPLEHNGPVAAAQFSPDGTLIVTASDDGAVRIWKAASLESVPVVLKHDGQVRSAVFSRDGKRLVTASWDRTARVWDVVQGRPIGAAMSHGNAVNWAAFNGDASQVVTASDDGTARVWDARTGEHLGPPLRHMAAVSFAGFNAAGLVVTASDSKVRLWDGPTGVLITALRHRGSANWASFTTDGMRLVTASQDNTARVWDVVTGQPGDAALLADLAEAVGGHRVNSAGGADEVHDSYARLVALRAQAGRPGAADSFIRWFFADPAARTVSPLSSVTVPDYITRTLDQRVAGCIAPSESSDSDRRREIERLFPGHPQLTGQTPASR